MELGDRTERGVVAAGTLVGGGALVVAATTKSNQGPWIAFAAAVLVAVLTAILTDRRQNAALNAEDRRQRTTLDAEDRRQRAALDAERERLQLRHEHERGLKAADDLVSRGDRALPRSRIPAARRRGARLDRLTSAKETRLHAMSVLGPR
jgi:membrane protein implicated in regulation of membrane protease activity